MGRTGLVMPRSRLKRLPPDVGPAREHPAFRRLLAGCLALAALIGLVFPAFTRYSLGPGGAMDLEVIDNPDKARFEILADGELAGFVLYYLSGDEIAFTHTETDDRFRGEGIGGRLVRSSLDAARERHLTVLPYCPFVRSWITGHREYADLVPEDRRGQFGL